MTASPYLWEKTLKSRLDRAEADRALLIMMLENIHKRGAACRVSIGERVYYSGGLETMFSSVADAIDIIKGREPSLTEVLTINYPEPT